MKPRLASITGKLKDTVIPMTEGPVLIGRQTGANLRIRNAAVSRRHAMIEKEGDCYVIADLDSRNGTFVNNIPVKRCELHHGDRVQIGERNGKKLWVAHRADDDGRSDDRHRLSDGMVC